MSDDAQLNLFDGRTYNGARDEGRLSKQLEAVRVHMLNGAWQTLSGLAAATGHPESSVSARLRDLRKARFGNYNVERRYIARGLWEYRLGMK